MIPIINPDPAHEAALDDIRADDRHWFETHPGQRFRHRPAFDHELCDPACFPFCVLVFEPPQLAPGDRFENWVEVEQHQPGCRTRRSYIVILAGEEALP